MSKLVRTHTDGGSRGNPGPAAIGAVVEDVSTGIKHEISRYIGHGTNNQAEYGALLAAVEKAAELGATEVECKLDSELVVKQMRGEYRVKDAELGKIFIKIHNVATKFKKISFHHVRREFNKEADRLVNEALDAHMER